MKTLIRPLVLSLLCTALVSGAAAKDTPISLQQCPAPVQAVIRAYEAQAKFESVTRDDKKKSGGPAVYEAKFDLPKGRKIEIHISPEGKVLQMEEK
jgi:hypothetical protein